MVFSREVERLLYKIAAPKDVKYTDLNQIKKEIHKRLDEKVGEELLVVNQHFETSHGCVKFLGGGHIRNYYNLGILDDKPKFDDNYLILPAKKHASRSGEGEWGLGRGNIKIFDFDLFGLDNRISCELDFVQTGCFGGETRIKNTSGMNHGIRIFTDKDVAQYFRGQSHRDNMGAYEVDFGDKKDVMDASYVTALKLLGGIDAPDDFKQLYKKESDKDRREIISNLESLIDKERNIEKRIKDVYGSIRHGGYMSGGALTVCENEDDAHVITIGHRQKLRDIEEEIKSMLKNAIKLDMLKEDVIIDGDKSGIKIHVKDYITSICEKYKVKIPA